MFIAAIAHHYSFPHKPFHSNIPHYGSDTNFLNAFLSMWDITDIQQDVTEHIGVVGSSLVRRLRGRNAYHMPRGTTSASEADCLIPSALSSGSMCYQSEQNSGTRNTFSNTTTQQSNRYGAIDNSIRKQNNTHDGINIVKQTVIHKDYSPQFGGAPKISNFFQPPNSSTSSSINNKNDNDKSTSDNTNTSTKSDTFTGLTTTGAAGSGISSNPTNIIKKSDSSASDWLSTPTDEMIRIDVKGLEKDSIVLTNLKM